MQRCSSQFRIIILLFVGFLFIAQPSWAGRVVKVKGKKVYIMLDASELDSTFKGDSLYLVTRSGKKRGLVIVRKMKGRKVIAQLKRGKAQKKMLTQARKSKKKKKLVNTAMEEADQVAETETESTEHPEMMFGLIGSYGVATQNVTGVADMSGSVLGFKAVFDYELFSGLGVKARLGMDMLSVTGTDGTINYQTDINYITLDFFLRYYILRGKNFGLYGNLGMGIYSPMSTELGTPGNEALLEDSISTTSVGIIGLGVAIPFGSMEIQVGGDYFIFPPSDDVKTSVFAAKVGVLFAL